jgi:chaperonin cofactor prefoldin
LAIESKSKKKKRKKGAKDIANGEISQTPAVSGASAEQEPSSRTIAAGNEEAEAEEETDRETRIVTPTPTEDAATALLANGTEQASTAEANDSTDSRFEALVKDRDSLRAEVTQLRQSIEALQAKHGTTLAAVQEELQESLAGKSHAEEQYQTLLGRVNTIKAQLGERLKADAVCPLLSELRERTSHRSDSVL